MKITYTKAMIAAAALSLGACANHDLIPDIAQVGQAVPTVYWEVGSTVCKAGDSFSFQGKYTSEPGRTPLRSEVWYQIMRTDIATVTSSLAGTALTYSQSVTVTDTMRSMQSHVTIPHSEDFWNGHEYIVNGYVPTSSTLSPVTWLEPVEWDAERFATYFPEGFKEDYLEKVYDYLTSEETAASYYTALRNVYINYAFTNDQFAAVGLPQIDMTGDDNGTSEKSDLWYATKEASESAVTGYYYITLDENGDATYNEVPTDYVAPEGITIYPVYDSCEWVFCRYDDNTGGIATTVRPEWLPKFRTLIQNIPFQDWIYDSSNTVYKVDFSRNYTLEAEFRAYDKDTDKLNDANAPEYEGIVSTTDRKTITIN
ncbi:MAG: hypothetical protein K2I69_06370 [Muribaculaceae bacterium]|nr:hypothetical protein [Muribaculaceae bacterium]